MKAKTSWYILSMEVPWHYRVSLHPYLKTTRTKTESAFRKHFNLIPALKGFKLLFICLLFLPWGDLLNGQIAPVCEDPTLIDAFYPCGTTFAPVCACNGVTYRNQCAATYHGGIQGNQWNSGPCKEFFFFLYPSICLNENLTVQYQFQNRGNATMYIFDNQGHLMLQRALQAGNNFPLSIDFSVSAFDAGLYYMLIQSNNHWQMEKFVVLHL